MSEWIRVEDKKPISHWHIVFVTDGKVTALARWINDPKVWYGKDLKEWDDDLQDEVPLDEEWWHSHWELVTEIGPFVDNDACFGCIGYISHWMPLPNLPLE